jgi:hypothetical protein
MDAGVFLNLFEVRTPETLNVYRKIWGGESIRDIAIDSRPLRIYADHNSMTLFAYGRANLPEELYLEKGFVPASVSAQHNPRFTGKLMADAISQHLQNMGFDLTERDYTSYKRELVDLSEPLKDFSGALRVYRSYNIQIMYLNIEETLRHFLIVAPKLRYEFSLPLDRYTLKAQCYGRLITVTCPSNCNVYSCKLHKWRGKVLGRFDKFKDSGFECEYLSGNGIVERYVALYDSRLDIKSIPANVCHIEASLANIRYLFGQVWSNKQVSSLMTQLRVLSGDLQREGRVNKEVGRKRYQDCLALVKRIPQVTALGTSFQITTSPVRAVEGTALVGQDYSFELEDEEDDEFGSSPF